MTKRYVFLVTVAAAMMAISFVGGVAADPLITGAQIKNGSVTGKDLHDGSLTGADVKKGSIPPGDLEVHPRLYTWSAHYTSDGVSTAGVVTSRGRLPENAVIRSVGMTYTGDTSTCVRHGNPDDPTINTGYIHVEVDAGTGFDLATYRSSVKVTSTSGSPAHAGYGNTVFTGSLARQLSVSATCLDVLSTDARTSPMPSYSITMRFEVTPVTMSGARAFH